MRHFDLLIKNGTLVTVDPDMTLISDGAVGITGGRIEAIDKTGTFKGCTADSVIDACNCIIMPGLVNTHTHLPMSLFRGLADDLELMTWLNDYIFKAEAKYITPENTKLGTEISCAEMLLSGTTTVCDGYFHEDVVAETVHLSGLKGVLGQGVIDFPAPGVPDPAKKIEHAVNYVRTIQEKYTTIKPSIFCHSPYTCSAETLVAAKQAADKAGVLFQIHVAETRDEQHLIQEHLGKTPVEHLYKAGVLDKNTLLVHCVWADENDINLIAKSGASIAHCPESNMKLASGTAPVKDFLTSGIKTGIGTDGSASNNNLDMFSEIDSAAKLQKVRYLDPSVADASAILKMATIDGAEAIGCGADTGSLEIGKMADIVLLDINRPHLVPMYNPVSHIVYAASGSDVRDVIINGQVVVQNRQVLTMDVAEILQRARQFANDLRL